MNPLCNRRIHTLSPYTSISENSDFLAGLVMVSNHIWGFIRPGSRLLTLILPSIVARGNEPIHDGPLCYRRAVNAGASADGNPALFQNGIIRQVVQASRQSVNQFKAIAS
jgi:hypothetical protein